MELGNKNLGLLMTRGMSLSKWERVGNLERELKPYIELSKSFNKIFIFSYGEKEDVRYRNHLPKNIEIVSRPFFIPAFLYAFLMPLIHAPTFRQIDILKTNQMDASWPGIIAKKLFSIKLVVRCGFELLDFLIRGGRSKIKIMYASMLEKFAYRYADKIILTSESDKEFVKNRFKIDPNFISVIPNYIDTEKFKPLGLAKEPGRVVFVGRLEAQKNLLVLISAMSGLPAALYLVGNGSLKDVIKKRAEEAGVLIEFLGNISQADMPAELGKSEIFVLPSLYEGNPKALLEAMSAGLPCVGTDVKGIKEVIDSGTDGMLVKSDPESLRAALKSLLENPDLRAKLGSNARETILRMYSLEIILIKEKAIYENLL